MPLGAIMRLIYPAIVDAIDDSTKNIVLLLFKRYWSHTCVCDDWM